jgi:hypothetical protein
MRVVLTGPTGIMFQEAASHGAINRALEFLTNNFDRTNAIRYNSTTPRFAYGREYYEQFTVTYSDGRVNQYNLLIVR